ncbi:MAG: TetR/AcrR family transcriptional regulator [Rhodospirillales bacterium]|nr:TetR/AcrR family transcriptional regulator [Rhodospirillales bacterium]
MSKALVLALLHIDWYDCLMSAKEPHSPTLGEQPTTVRRILDAARIEFGANGFDGTKVEHIARRAGVSKQSVYFYFEGKDELYAELLKEISGATLDQLFKIDYASLPPIEAARRYVEAVYDAFAKDPVAGVVSLDQSMHRGAQLRPGRLVRQRQDLLGEILADIIRRGRNEGVIGEHIDENRLEFMTLIVAVNCASSTEMFERYIGRSWDLDAIQTRAFAVDFLLRALAP